MTFCIKSFLNMVNSVQGRRPETIVSDMGTWKFPLILNIYTVLAISFGAPFLGQEIVNFKDIFMKF